MSMNELIQSFLEKVASLSEVELYGFEIQSGKKSKKLIIYLDKKPSITSDDCDRYAKQFRLNAAIDFPSLTQMLLEVSSPGVERRLFTLNHCSKNLGQTVKIKLKTPMDEKRNYIGCLEDVKDQLIVVKTNESERSTHLDWQNIEKIRIIYEERP